MELITLSELESKVSINERNSTEVNKTIELSQLCSSLGILTEPKFRVSNQDGKYYFESGYVVVTLINSPLQITLSYWDYRKQYTVACYDSYEYCDASHCDSIKKQNKQITEPQNIGVLTPKKVIAWVHYYQQLHALYAAKNVENKARIDAFMIELQKAEKLVIKSAKNNVDNKVIWSKDRSQGWLMRNGLEYNFQIIKGSGYVSQSLKVRGGNTLADFITISDNKYKG